LQSEIEKDLDRLWTRNLGRDDRCVANQGKELRLPFLDSGVVQFAKSSILPGNKIALRAMVENDLGLPRAARREKLAAQFGSRMAKMAPRGLKGTDVFTSLSTTI